MTALLQPTRRSMLAGAACIALPWAAHAKSPAHDWRLGFRNAPAEGVGPIAMRQIHGRLPKELSGVLYRNGPAQFRWGDDVLGHWFDGDGLVRAFTLADDRASLTARFVATRKRAVESDARAFVMPGFGNDGRADAPVRTNDDVNAANTSVLLAGDDLWALWEAGSPFALDPKTLQTRGPVTFRPDLAHMPFSAHPKRDRDGRIWNFGIGGDGSRLIVWALASDGSLERAELIETPRAAYLHDWAMTARSLIIPLQSWVYERNTVPVLDGVAWRPDLGMEVLVLDKADLTPRGVWSLPPGAFFHTGSAWEEANGVIRFDLCLSDAPTVGADQGAALIRGDAKPEKHDTHYARVTLGPDGTADLERSALRAEFPTVDPRANGDAPSKTFFTVQSGARPDDPIGFDTLGAYDPKRDQITTFAFGADHIVEEHVYAPHPDQDGSGWLVGTTLNLKESATELHILRADSIEEGPVASFRSDAPLPLSFHGVWAASS